MYLVAQFPHGREPLHLVFLARHRSQDAHSMTLRGAGGDVWPPVSESGVGDGVDAGEKDIVWDVEGGGGRRVRNDNGGYG